MSVTLEQNKPIGIASDHGGFRLKNKLKAFLKEEGYQVLDLGCDSEASVDYPDYAEKLTDQMVRGTLSVGILVCGTGQGVTISANKIPGIRAALCHEPYSASMARRHNNANVLTLGERVIGEGLAKAVVRTFLSTSFDGGRHEKRVEKIHELEQRCAHGKEDQ